MKDPIAIGAGPFIRTLIYLFIWFSCQLCESIHGITCSGDVGHVGVLIHAQACSRVVPIIGEEPSLLWLALSLRFDQLGYWHPLELLHRCVWDLYPSLFPVAYLSQNFI